MPQDARTRLGPTLDRLRGGLLLRRLWAAQVRDFHEGVLGLLLGTAGR